VSDKTTQPFRPVRCTYVGPDGRVHVAGPFDAGAAAEYRRSASRAREAHTCAAMLAAAEHIEAWEREHPREEAA
jgi:hypothetical protein